MITLALDRYDRHMPFFDGTVAFPAGLDVRVLQVGQSGTLRDGTDRHERMLQDGAFDAAETSLASYVAARARGLPFTAIPVFPRRLFSQGQIFVHGGSGIASPADLAGRTIALQSFQTTLAVLAKGDLATEYGVPLETILWRVAAADAVEVAGDGRFDVEPLPAGADLSALLAAGAVDAMFYSRTPQPAPDPAGPIRRLFPDPRAEEARFVARNGYWPIMHLVALKEEAVAAHPDLPMALMAAFAEADTLSAGYFADPNWSRMPWAKYGLEEERAAIGRDLWTAGLAANRANLERFLGYAAEQGLTDGRLAPEDLFHPSVRET